MRPCTTRATLRGKWFHAENPGRSGLDAVPDLGSVRIGAETGPEPAASKWSGAIRFWLLV